MLYQMSYFRLILNTLYKERNPFSLIYSFCSSLLTKAPQKSGERRIRTFEACATDLQSVPFGHSGISPNNIKNFRADGGIRTPDQLITNQLLWPTELHRHNFQNYLFRCLLHKKKQPSSQKGLQSYKSFIH
jgi:hypothetical protein